MALSVVLVEPEIGENIGFVARAMQCYALKELIIIGHDTMPDAAYKTGTSAKNILETAQLFPTLEKALAQFQQAIAFSRRHFDIPQDHIFLNELSQDLSRKSALVFGRESQGLSREEILLCSKVCEIPTHSDTMSFNLGQAVAIALYELATKTPTSHKYPTEASMQSKQALASLLEEKSDTTFLAKGNRSENLKGIVSKLALSDDEISLLAGIIRSI